MKEKFIAEVSPVYLKRKNLIKTFILNSENTLGDLDKLIRKNYQKEKDDIFDFSDFTHLSLFCKKNERNIYRTELKMKQKISSIYPKIRKLKYIFDLGEEHKFNVVLTKKWKKKY